MTPVQRGVGDARFDHLVVCRDITQGWFAKKSGPTGPGLEKTFRDEALQACLPLRLCYPRTLRSMEGFVNSLFFVDGITVAMSQYPPMLRSISALDRFVEDW